MATMADIAERAGVALSTVSYVLSGKRSVSEETKQRVFRAIAELDYQPHALARGLASKRTKTIALLFPVLAKGHSEMRLEFVAQAAEVAAEHGYAFLLWSAPDNDAEILQTNENVQPVTVALNKFIGQYGTQWNKLMAVATTIALPIILIFASLQRYIVGGLVA